MKLERERRTLRDFLPLNRQPVPVERSLAEAVAWIHRAQDQGIDRGVSHSYLLGRGWMPSYPETTGYIIPTLLSWSHHAGDAGSRDRALEMADWECSIQSDDGSIQGGVIGQKVRPVIFNTGQVVFGWVSAYRATGLPCYLDAGERAVGWMLSRLDDYGTWKTNGNMGENRRHTYNVQAAWAVLEHSRLVGEAYHDAVRRMLPWFLAQERGNGWFDNNCLNDDKRPLLHTIGYTARGFLECGLILNDQSSVDAAIRTARALSRALRPAGDMPGRFNCQWGEEATWSCLTGIAQMSIVWRKLGTLLSDSKLRDCANRANRFLRTVQDVRSRSGGIRGGIAGSHPVNGGYAKYRYLNWATKYFIDAHLLEVHPEWIPKPTDYPG